MKFAWFVELRGRGRPFLTGVCAAALLVSLAHASEGDLDPLMRLLAARRHGEVSFVEQHFMKLTKRPVESMGELVYDAPDRLEKRTLEPRPETLAVAGRVLTIERKGRSHVVDLNAYPAVVPFVEGIRATLAGDLGSLERVFTVDYVGDLARWALTLTPRDPAVARTVARVRIDGTRDILLTVEILETDGDRSLMTLRHHASP
jgi:Outer membrane lipoprotein carrier protein LolA-like